MDSLLDTKALNVEALEAWRDIDSAPKDLTYADLPKQAGLPFRMRMSRPCALLTKFNGEYRIIKASWSDTTENDNHRYNQEYWWDIDAEEPIDEEIIGWMPLPLDDDDEPLLPTGETHG